MHGQARAMGFIDLNVRGFLARRGEFELLHSHGHSNVLCMRPHLAKPAEAAGDNEHRAQDADSRIGYQACEGERQAHGEHQRPRSRGG
jgi:hypothetical protein